ncbi:MAG: Rieske 2Fe-2S domain-containing protein [Pseudomonadales bacterium]|nr:Rieske 2Fe-2S domain-containing protein [Pseudomonadales bacterium]
MSTFKNMRADLDGQQAHHQNWYVVAFADELKAGEVIGKDFLNTRVAVYRKACGEVVVTTARCPHMGADLSLGDVVNDQLRCAYHHFSFDCHGVCQSVPSNDPVPPGAKIFSYPCVERFGLIWAFNGEKPRFPPPEARDFGYENLRYRARKTDVFNHAPWINIGNVFDFLHLKYVHGLSFDYDVERINYLDDYHIENEIQFDTEHPYESRIRITGTNTVAYTVVTDTASIGLFTLTPIGTQSHSYCIALTPDNNGDSEAVQEKKLRFQESFADMLLVDDVRTLTGLKFKVGAMLREDQALVKFFRWVHQFPVNEASRDFE